MISMKKELNISEILKGKPKGVRLYSPIFSDCTFSFIQGVTDAICVIANNNREFFDYKGLYSPTGERLLFPSKKMRDWRKFDWKKGDVLVNSSGFKLFFDRWANDDYTRFFGKVNLLEDSFSYETEKYTLASKEETLDTLEIEKPEFKDGDIVTMHKKNCDIVFIFNRLKTEGSFYYYAFHTLQTNNTGVIDCHITLPYAWTFFGGKMNFATDSEKQQLFGALTKEGKAWNAEKKQIVDLKPEVEFKPFDRVVVRDKEDLVWFADLFSHIDKENNRFACIGNFWNVCLPYNEETAKLIGTTNNVEG